MRHIGSLFSMALPALGVALVVLAMPVWLPVLMAVAAWEMARERREVATVDDELDLVTIEPVADYRRAEALNGRR